MSAGYRVFESCNALRGTGFDDSHNVQSAQLSTLIFGVKNGAG